MVFFQKNDMNQTGLFRKKTTPTSNKPPLKTHGVSPSPPLRPHVCALQALLVHPHVVVDGNLIRLLGVFSLAGPTWRIIPVSFSG